jgi:apolipoprotein N-acyltransferase
MIFSLLAGAFTSLAWLEVLPGFFGVLAVFCLVLALKTKPKSVYVGGVIAIGVAFYWLLETIEKFGGFSFVPALLIYLFFVFASASSFAFAAYFYGKIPTFLPRAAIAFTAVELLPYLLFPWKFGHLLLEITPVAMLASVGGASLLTFLMFLLAEAIIERKIIFFIPILALLPVGFSPKNEQSGKPISVTIVQANVTTEQKREVLSFADNLERYLELTPKDESSLVIWPESVFQEWLHSGLRFKAQDPRLEKLPNNFIFGALTFDSEAVYYNSALAIKPDGRILEPYHKRILMPFGEFMPLADRFPSLLALNPQVGQFSAGKKSRVWDFESFKISPLICYEDIVPSMSRDSVLEGAEVLVNLTNDAWFGHTHAPTQHNRIASFRAIENGRYLIRSTNSGKTAVIDPRGQIIASLPHFSDGVLKTEVFPRRDLTIYTEFVGEGFGSLCLYLSLGFVVLSWVRARF